MQILPQANICELGEFANDRPDRDQAQLRGEDSKRQETRLSSEKIFLNLRRNLV
jgi:hypothetical protein